MFRGGSTNMNGIMSGIEDRENYAEGTASERYKKVFDQYSKPAMDPLSKLLIQGGLRGLSETRGGGTLANMALAFEKPTEQLMSDLQQRKNAERDMALAGLGMDIEDERSREAALQKVKNIQDKQKFDLSKIETESAADVRKMEREYELKDQYGTETSNLQKDYSPERVYYETLQKYTDPKAAGYITTVQQEYPEAFAEFAAYIGPSIRKNENLKGGFIGTLPNKKKGKTREYIFDEMIPGAIYFKPDTKKLYERDPEQNILIEYDPYSGKKLREIPLQ
jgi:hypothetical protein